MQRAAAPTTPWMWGASVLPVGGLERGCGCRSARWLPGVRVLAVPALPLPRPLAVRHLSWFHRSLVGPRETRESHGQGRDVFVQGSCGGWGEGRRPFPESSVSSLTSLAQVLPLQPSTDRKEGVSPVPGRHLVGERRVRAEAACVTEESGLRGPRTAVPFLPEISLNRSLHTT